MALLGCSLFLLVVVVVIVFQLDPLPMTLILWESRLVWMQECWLDLCATASSTYPITNKPFVCDRVTQLRRRLSTDWNEIWQVDPDQVKERFYVNRFGIIMILQGVGLLF